MEKLHNKVKNNQIIYCLARTLKNLRDPDLYAILQGYYENSDLFQTLLVKHEKNCSSQELIYNISLGIESETYMGLCGMLRVILEYLSVAEKFNFIPVVNIGNKSLYYDSGMDDKTLNVFEYYFKPISDISCKALKECHGIVNCRYSHMHLGLNDETLFGSSLYTVSEDTIAQWANTYKKYIKLNDEVNEHIHSDLLGVLCDKQTIGVHFRGTDFNVGFKNHPKVGSITDYIDKVKKFMKSHRYDQMFLATDDINALKIFENEFGNHMVYYKDTFRSDGRRGLQTLKDTRDLHKFKLGYEVLRDVYTLAQCNSLIAGPSYVSFAARYIKRSMDSNYENIDILNNGIYSREGRQVRKEIRRIRKQSQRD